MARKKKHLYFAYCVNMLSSRMECCVDKNIVQKGHAKLDGYKLLFGSYNEEWEGCLPTIVKSHCSDDVVWGVLWEVDNSVKPRLDRLQGVTAKIYQEFEVDVNVFKSISKVRAMTYRLSKRPATPILYKEMQPKMLPKMQYRPSKLYLEEMIKGAEEAGLPTFYLRKLKITPHNGFIGKSSGELSSVIL
ncbi:gamma-glutamylcyclotransferase [Halyomorpha halys]|uniref:gamma-glutamylcyclotransferase n=1 Tax=Halyomorpha halys TaxID=286706 RepID=UPI0006D52372|nr:gamma-glutamylcyclotransferase-like [Halyomorpha halys]